MFDARADAEEAIQSLSRSGFDVKQLSLLGKGYHSEEHPVGFYAVGDKNKAWGGAGAFWGDIWGGIWGLLLAPAVFVLPGVGVVAMASPVVAALAGALEGAVLVSGVSAIGAALSQVGAPKDQVIKFETALKVDKYVLLVQGNAEDQAEARSVLASSKALATA